MEYGGFWASCGKYHPQNQIIAKCFWVTPHSHIIFEWPKKKFGDALFFAGLRKDLSYHKKLTIRKPAKNDEVIQVRYAHGELVKFSSDVVAMLS